MGEADKKIGVQPQVPAPVEPVRAAPTATDAPRWEMVMHRMSAEEFLRLLQAAA